MGSPASVSVSCSTSYYYPPDCATTLTRRDPKHTHTHSQSSPLSHTSTGQAISQVLFLLRFMGTLKFSPGRECRHNNQSSCHQAPSARWSGCFFKETHPVEDIFPFLHAGIIGKYNSFFSYLLSCAYN